MPRRPAHLSQVRQLEKDVAGLEGEVGTLKASMRKLQEKQVGGPLPPPPHPKNKAQTKRLAGWAKGETFMEFFPQSADPIPAFELGKETSGRRCYP